MNRRALMIALLVAFVGIASLAAYLHRYEQEVSGGDLVQLLVTLKPIPSGAVISEDMLTTRSIPRAYVEDRAILARDRDKIIGLRIGQSLEAQQLILWTDLTIAMEERRSLSALIQPGMRAFTISAMSRGDKGYAMIRPGDRIDVIATLPSPTDKEQTRSVVLLQNVLVLAVGTDVGGQQDRSKERNELVLSLSLTVEESQLVTLATDKGKLSVVLRNPDDVRVKEGASEMTAAALADVKVRSRLQRRRPGPVRVEGDPD